MSQSPATGTEAAPLIVNDNQDDFRERFLALERRERRVTEAEQLMGDCECRILMDGRMVPVFTLDAKAVKTASAHLEAPIALASRAQLERILLRICTVSEVAKTVTVEMLPPGTKQHAESALAGLKRRFSDPDVIYKCTHCKLRFGSDKDLAHDCTYHPGFKDVDSDAQRSEDGIDFWADHDEECHGNMESLADEPDYARGFVWTCCDQRGDADGCKMREHDVWIKRPHI